MKIVLNDFPRKITSSIFTKKLFKKKFQDNLVCTFSDALTFSLVVLMRTNEHNNILSPHDLTITTN